MEKIRINYDDDVLDIVSTFSSLLAKFGLELVELEGGDGYMEYQVQPQK